MMEVMVGVGIVGVLDRNDQFGLESEERVCREVESVVTNRITPELGREQLRVDFGYGTE